MNKTKIVIISLLIGAISGCIFYSYFYRIFVGLFFGIAVILCLRKFFKHKISLGQSIGFIFASFLACFLAVWVHIGFGLNQDFFILLVTGIFSSLILVFSYAKIFRIKFNSKHKLILLGLCILSLM